MNPVEALRWRWRKWTDEPEGLSNREQWFFRAVIIGYPLGALVHVLFFLLFLRWGVSEMVVFNLISIPFYLGNLALARNRRLLLSYVLAGTEVNLHAILGVHFLGWTSGLQYYMITSIIACLMIIERDAIKFLVVSGHILLFVGLYQYSASIGPSVYAVDATELQAFSIINIMASFGITTLITAYYITLAQEAEAALEREHEKSERLLRNVLPEPIADRLKEEPDTIADRFSSASILFADLVGFSEVARELQPEQLVNGLNRIFSRFDDLVEEHNLEKIKTVGDEYMVASGLPNVRADHAEAIARFALDMREELRSFNNESRFDFELRIGINSGQVVAGVIGKKRFLYDLWGDSVNLASRMESQGVPGEIQVSSNTASLITPKFEVRQRGELDVKGIGSVQTYFLRGPDGEGAS